MIARTMLGASVLVVIGLGGCATQHGVGLNAKTMTAETGTLAMVTMANGEEQPCALYVPPGYDPRKEWPLVVFLHGMGERGRDGVAQTTVGIGPAIEENPDRFPCLVLMPQCSPDYVWTSPKALGHIDNAIEQALEKYSVDRNRLSLTGLSMGGFGSFQYGALHADMFSAVMPICGGGNPDQQAEALARLPMRVFHGADDPVVTPERSKVMVEAVRKAGGDIRYTEYPETGHNSWDQAYGDGEAIAWLLAQKRR